MRQVNINNKVVVFDSGIALPSRGRLGGRQKGELRMILEEMRPGESVLLQKDPQIVAKRSGLLSELGKKLGVKFAYRAQGRKTRIFCVEREQRRLRRVA